MRKRIRKHIALTAAAAVMLCGSLTAYAGTWQHKAEGWAYFDDMGEQIRESFVNENGKTYHIGRDGILSRGWIRIGDRTYFAYPYDDSRAGEILTGWQWIDGRCYYFGTGNDGKTPGEMYVNTVTPDGYTVGAAGSWTVDGTEQTAAGRGYSSDGIKPAVGQGTFAAGGFSGGGGSGGGGGSYGGGSGSGNGTDNSVGNGADNGGGNGAGNGGDSAGVSDGSAGKEADPGQPEETAEGDDDTTDVSRDETAERILAGWLERAREADSLITGEEADDIPDERIICDSVGAADVRIRSLADQIRDSNEYCIYVIGRNSVPNGIALKEFYGNDITYSETMVGQAVMGNDTYTCICFVLKKKINQSACIHDWEFIYEDPRCLTKGSSLYLCMKCGAERNITVPPAGHVDEDGDSFCDRCRGRLSDIPEEDDSGGTRTPASPSEDLQEIHYEPGETIAKDIDGKTYLFTCIDQNYSDKTENYGQNALFLCETIIPSSYGGGYEYEERDDGREVYVYHPGPIAYFGDSNDYKYSNIREFLDSVDVYGAEEIQIGLPNSYTGRTKEGRYSNFSAGDLKSHSIGYQQMDAKLFILSVDEAVKYRNYLWKFNGSESDNPDEAVSSYGRSYWLRSPAGTEDDWETTDQVYVVDLDSGSIHPAGIQPEGGTGDAMLDSLLSTGIRPCFVLPQN